ncbi:hypothetical protein D3C86_1720590 [compost metagenome]
MFGVSRMYLYGSVDAVFIAANSGRRKYNDFQSRDWINSSRVNRCMRENKSCKALLVAWIKRAWAVGFIDPEASMLIDKLLSSP